MNKNEKRVALVVMLFNVTRRTEGKFGPYRFDYWKDGTVVMGFGFLLGWFGVSFAREFEYLANDK